MDCNFMSVSCSGQKCDVICLKTADHCRTVRKNTDETKNKLFILVPMSRDTAPAAPTPNTGPGYL